MIVENFFITKYDYSKNKRVWFKKLFVIIDENNLFKLKAFSNYEDAKKYYQK